MIDCELMKSAISTWGQELQMNLAQEECGELIVAIAHYKRHRQDARKELSEEMADVEIMLYQLKEMIGNHGEVEEIIDAKMKRLKRRLEVTVFNAV